MHKSIDSIGVGGRFIHDEKIFEIKSVAGQSYGSGEHKYYIATHDDKEYIFPDFILVPPVEHNNGFKKVELGELLVGTHFIYSDEVYTVLKKDKPYIHIQLIDTSEKLVWRYNLSVVIRDE